MMDWGYGHFGFGWLVWLTIIVLIIWAVVRLTSQTGSQKTDTPAKETPEEILKKRYARGEITKEEFEEMKKNLRS